VTLTDASTDDAPLPPGAIYINWGDGSPFLKGDSGGTFTHTYIWSGKFVIRLTVQDVGKASNTMAKEVTIGP